MWTKRAHWLLYGAAWGLMGLYYATWDAVAYNLAFLGVLPMNLCQNAIWGLEGLLLMAVARRFPITAFDRRSLPAWIINLGASLLLTCVGLASAWLLSVAFMEPSSRAWIFRNLGSSLRKFTLMYFHSTLLLMWAVQGAYHGFRLYREMRRQELEKAQLESRLAEARNQNLVAQFQPHFLFNALNSISSLVHADPEAADRMIARLGDLLRISLETGPGQEVSLERELALVDSYLAIEKVRFQDRLEVQVEVPAALARARVPRFVLQPLVENAIRHGIAPRARSGRINIRAAAAGDQLALEVRDDGAGFDGTREGIGLRNTRERLRMLYHDQQSFEIFSLPDKGTVIILRIPLRTS
ncbi:sensor histidine kinase [Mesoterricola sediminis]|uniref:ATPase n=1 Tax=Mesoterricola sediminis TaxID=2927980 RepID=A0AA48KD39_9BACT|nr:histidine kinase [Mesoterricola sediminis]BDU77839.1 ATPase [Mesoterricola sediminis]